MKKIRDRNSQIRLSNKRFRKEFKRRKKKRIERRRTSRADYNAKTNILAKRRILRLKARHNKYVELTPPDNFSIIDNSDKTIEFFEKLQGYMSKYEPVKVDMANIKRMTVDALVYYIAVLQKVKMKYQTALLRGSFPQNEKINLLMRRSGFLKYFKTSEDNIETHKDFIEIKSGNVADNETVKSICLFVIDKLSVRRINTQKLYDIIFEMMLNTKHHAYNPKFATYDNWLIFLRFVPEKKSVEFIFMDTGYGIPNTVAMTKIEKARMWFSSLGITEFTESDLVLSALQGALRTKTKTGYRGKGLPRIYKAYRDGYILNLNILSNKACLNGDDKCDIQKEMIGTLYFWKITKESISENTENM